MGDVIETIRLFRNKPEDIWAIYLAEFFKMIGCIVYDYTVTQKEKLTVDSLVKKFPDVCDADILCNIGDQETETIKGWKKRISGSDCAELIYVSLDVPAANSFLCLRQDGRKVVEEQIIGEIWNRREDELKDICKLFEIYTKYDLFFYYYNKGNLKFVQEYYPLYGREGRVAKEREAVYQLTFKKFHDAYQELLLQKKENRSFYFQYALVYLKYRLNCVEKLMADTYLFSIEALLDEITEVERQYPGFVRTKFLKAGICEMDPVFVWDAEMYYLKAIFAFRECHGEKSAMEDFLHYRLGKYYEKKRKNNKKAEARYRLSYQFDPLAFRSQYKIAKISEQKKNYYEANKVANDIIDQVLNGYEMSQLMPKQQIYIYKSFVLLGDLFAQNGIYDTAILGYRRALEMSGIVSNFFRQLAGEEEEEEKKIKIQFANIIKACMPEHPVLTKIISCASKIDNRELVEDSFKQLAMGEQRVWNE